MGEEGNSGPPGDREKSGPPAGRENSGPPARRAAGWRWLLGRWRKKTYLRPMAAGESWGATWATIFSPQPVILGIWPNLGFPLGIASALGPWLHDLAIEFLVMPAWAWELPEISGPILSAAAEHRALHPNHRFYFLCNTQAQERAFADAGWPVTTMNTNMFVDEATFFPLPASEPLFDAVYNARLTSDKRQDLAAGIERLCLIYYHGAELPVGAFHAEHARLSGLMPKATFLNRLTADGCEFLDLEDINRALNQSRVGLCLSPVEGQMRASMEYLMAGLPIVSTPSIGGRDYFFDPDYCAIVPPDPRAIADAVAAMVARNIPRNYVRERTLARVKRERERFIAFVQSHIEREGGSTDFAERFSELHREQRIKDWRTDVRAFAELLDAIVVEAERFSR